MISQGGDTVKLSPTGSLIHLQIFGVSYWITTRGAAEQSAPKLGMERAKADGRLQDSTSAVYAARYDGLQLALTPCTLRRKAL